MNTRTFRFAHGADRTARLILSLCTVLWLSSCSQREGLQITANVQQIDMGRTVQIEASYTPSQGDSVREVILMPYVNGRRWGSHEFPDSNGRAVAKRRHGRNRGGGRTARHVAVVRAERLQALPDRQADAGRRTAFQ